MSSINDGVQKSWGEIWGESRRALYNSFFLFFPSMKCQDRIFFLTNQKKSLEDKRLEVIKMWKEKKEKNRKKDILTLT